MTSAHRRCRQARSSSIELGDTERIPKIHPGASQDWVDSLGQTPRWHLSPKRFGAPRGNPRVILLLRLLLLLERPFGSLEIIEGESVSEAAVASSDCSAPFFRATSFWQLLLSRSPGRRSLSGCAGSHPPAQLIASRMKAGPLYASIQATRLGYARAGTCWLPRAILFR